MVLIFTAGETEVVVPFQDWLLFVCLILFKVFFQVFNLLQFICSQSAVLGFSS